MRRIKYLYLLILIGLAVCLPSWAQRIPLRDRPLPANDLYDVQGQWVSPQRAELLRQSGVDLSTLNPSDRTDLWNPRSSEHRQPKRLDLDANRRFRFQSTITSRSQTFRFSASQSLSGDETLHSFLLSRQSYVILLRARLLEKLGYRVPPVQRIQRMTLEFSTDQERELFVSSVQGDTFADPKRWITETSSSGAPSLVLQDVLAFEHQPSFYNLAMGRVPRAIIEGRRLLNSLSVAYELVDVPESVNLLSWEFAKTVSDSLVLGFEEASEFFPNVDDARWMARRIVSLTEDDLRDVAFGAELPQAVALLLFEKLKSRRNDLAQDFALQATRMSVDLNVQFQQDLVRGKLVREKWDGYAARFSFGDPTNPLSNPELIALVKVKAFSNVLGNLVNLFNTEVLPSVDASEQLAKVQLERARERFLDFVRTGQTQKVSFGAMVVPTANGGVIATRDVVIGSYLGSDNQVQLADSIGVFVRAGAAFAFEGLPTHVGMAGAAAGSFVRTYSHLRPIQSMASVLKYPLKNLLVGAYAQETADRLRPLSDSAFENLPDEAKTEVVRKVFELFDQNLGVGESLIVTDALSADFALEGSYSSSEWAKIYGRIEAGQLVTNRTHILRYDASTIHVYRDHGTAIRLQLAAGLRAKVTVFEVSGSFRNGQARTRFFRLPMSEDFFLGDSSAAVSQTRALMAVLQSGSFELLDATQTPFVLDYKFDEQISKLQILPWRFGSFRTHLTLNVNHPDPAARERTFFRRIQARLEGTNYEALVLDAINAGISELGGDNISVRSTSDGRPGDSIGGSSLVRSLVVDGELFERPQRGRADLRDRFLSLNYQWRGWSLSAKGLENVIDIVESKAPSLSPREGAFHNLEALHFYNIEYAIQIYEQGLIHAMNLSESELHRIFKKHGKEGAQWGREWFLFHPLLKRRSLHRHNVERGIVEYSSKDLADFVSLCEIYLSLDGLSEMFGGTDHVFATFRVTGFREGQEDGDRPYVSNTFGRFGSTQIAGPWHALKSHLQIADSEFFLHWMLERP
jgi:hypothetical protein